MSNLSSKYSYSEFVSYKEHVKNRNYLFETESSEIIEASFIKLYLVTQIFDDFIIINQRDVSTNNFIIEAKSNLIITFDLINLNYLKASIQLSRSSIEQLFRFILSLTRTKEYEFNKANGVYNTTESLKSLRSNIDTHKVGKMTRYVKLRFENTPIDFCIDKLYEYYGEFSKLVHVNKRDHFTKNILLSDYNSFDDSEITQFIHTYSEIMDLYILILYYLYNKYNLINYTALSKRQWLHIEDELDEVYKDKLEKLLES